MIRPAREAATGRLGGRGIIDPVTLPTASSGLAEPSGYEPDAGGHWGLYGGRHVPEALMAVIEEVTAEFEKVRTDRTFLAELDRLQAVYTGRPSPLYPCVRLNEHAGGAKLFLKREDLNHTGSHKINNVLGQVLLAQRMGKTRVIAETGAGQHGVATATACALLGIDCVIYMGKVDTDRQALNVARMRLLGAEVIAVASGSATLKDAINEALRDWVTNADDTYYAFGTAAGPHPFPLMVRDLQRIVGLEAREQIQTLTGRLPDAVVACVGGGSNAIGIFHPFIADAGVELVGCEAAGDGVETGRHAATITGGTPGAFQGAYSYLLQDEDGQTIESHSISAGLDYPGVGPEHAQLRDSGRARYIPITDAEAMDAFALLCRTEGIIPAIESAHAVAGALKVGAELGEGANVVVSLSGRGDKDVDTAGRWFGLLDSDGNVVGQKVVGADLSNIYARETSATEAQEETK
ncbi:tryptophan synthase subunit beta [Tsukamurella soli]|uniref:Tryptophan synthase beta chain n=1 Tax=Tsukamurella soli TaxID=644556 RepID=A0ABP8JWV8_9ACTN